MALSCPDRAAEGSSLCGRKGSDDNCRNRCRLHRGARRERIERGGRDGVRRAFGAPPNEEEWYEEKDCRGSCRFGDTGIGRTGGRGNKVGSAHGADGSAQG